MHKTGNVLNCLPKSMQPKAKQALHDIWQADTRGNAEKAFELFVKTYEAKYPKPRSACKEIKRNYWRSMTFLRSTGRV